jgi:hypothetical protein
MPPTRHPFISIHSANLSLILKKFIDSFSHFLRMKLAMLSVNIANPTPFITAGSSDLLIAYK